MIYCTRNAASVVKIIHYIWEMNFSTLQFSRTAASNMPWLTKKVNRLSNSSSCSFTDNEPIMVANTFPTDW